jgi:hypothetical protein
VEIIPTNSRILDYWAEPPYTSTFDFYLWNITNLDEIKQKSSIPKVSQIGPISYDVLSSRKNISFTGNETVLFKNFLSFNFSPTRSDLG